MNFFLFVSRMRMHLKNAAAEEKQSSNLGIPEFRYNLDKEYPDLYVKSGGWKRSADENNLRALGLVGMSAIRVGLESVSTNFLSN